MDAYQFRGDPWMLTNLGEIHLLVYIDIYTMNKLFYFIRHIRGCTTKRGAAEVYCNLQNLIFSNRSLSFFIIYTQFTCQVHTNPWTR